MKVSYNNYAQIPSHCQRREGRRAQRGTLSPISRSEIACLGDRIVQQFPPAGLIVGPVRFIVGIVIGIFAAIGAGIAYYLDQDKVCEELSFIARRGVDESLRGFYEALVFLISSRDFDRDTREGQGYIRDGEAYGRFMYRGPEGSIAYSQENVSGSVEWRRISDQSWEWSGYASSISSEARARASIENNRIRKENQIELQELSDPDTAP